MTKKWESAPDIIIDENKNYSVILHTTVGDISIDLFVNESPITVNNFVFLAKEGFYNGVKFHRVIKNFMIQTGDPTATGCGGPGYSFNDELPVKHSYDIGIVAMANAGANTNGSQFFICCGKDAKALDNYPNYTQFGKVVDGLNVVTEISKSQVRFNPYSGETSTLVVDCLINSIDIIEK